MLIKIDLESDLFHNIKKLVDEGKYDDILQFVKIAVTNQIQEELSGPNIQSETLVSQPSVLTQVPLSNQMEEEKTPANWRELLTKLPLKNSEIKPDYKTETMIWSFYNRFLPVKIIVYHLGKMMASHSATWIELTDLQDEASDFALKISTALSEYEEEHGLTRNKKLSTGLPTSYLKPRRGKRITKRQIDEKLLASKTRFLEQFIGRPKREGKEKIQTFSGACFTFGLLAVKFVKEQCLVSLTDLGREFALLENPILDQEKYEHEKFSKSFSDYEISLIWNKIISKFKTEKETSLKVIELLQSKPRKSEAFEHIFNEESFSIYQFYSNDPDKLTRDRKDDILTQAKVAIMGRLSELKIVNWELEHGKSIYSLNKEKLPLLNLN